jgi:hypothetical protein
MAGLQGRRPEKIRSSQAAMMISLIPIIVGIKIVESPPELAAEVVEVELAHLSAEIEASAADWAGHLAFPPTVDALPVVPVVAGRLPRLIAALELQ